MLVMHQFHIITMLLTIQITKTYSTTCKDKVSIKRKLSLKSFCNNTGHWIAQVSVLYDSGISDNNIKARSYPLNIDLNFERERCSGVEFQKIEAVLTIPPLTPGPDYEFYAGMGYYKFHPELKTWQESKAICESEGAHLAILNTDAESKLLKQMFDQYPDLGKYAFVGFHDQKAKDVCKMQREDGDCQEALQKWYYDGSSRSCRQFSYTGCGGNGNRFSSQEECESVCLQYQGVHPIGNGTAVSRQDGPPSIDITESDVQAEEGSYVTLKCIAQGFPTPHIVWRKGSAIIDGSNARYRLLLDGSLQIIGLYRSDAGVYMCTADNGVGQPDQKETHLKVTDPHLRPAEIIGEDNTCVVVSLGAPTSLHCYAVGWPRPSVTWWRGDFILPLSSGQYEQRRDYSLLIRSVALRQLGPYTCQAYNGQGPATSWTVTVHAIGPVYSTNPIDRDYFQFLVPAPTRAPESNKMASPHTRPSYPYQHVCPPHRPRPAETQTITAMTMTTIHTTTTPQPAEEQEDENILVSEQPRIFIDEPLSSTGFTEFTRGEPDNHKYRGNEADAGKTCGSINRDGKLNVLVCTVKSPFICEQEI